MEWYIELKQFATNFDKLNNTFDATHFKRIIPIQHNLPDKYVLKINTLQFNYSNFNLECKESIKLSYKDKIILHGRSGSGKTTFIKLFRNILIPNAHNVEIVHKNERFKLEDGFGNVSQTISYCQQNGITFVNGTLQQIVASDKFDNELFEQVCNIALIPNNLINKENINATDISGGEHQRINIAKTLYRALKLNTKILIFDESDNNLDEQTSKQIYDNIFRIFNKKLVIIIAHSDSIKKRTDFTKEIFMNNGVMISRDIKYDN
jgi:ABC-type bacteriocin/lantibiotic exporter with double-glycine peptidase domain